ncbi:hypothetical protein ACWCPM_05445 [Streptomyces sp. NPDC002309]
MSSALPKYHRRRLAMIGGECAVVLSATVIAQAALAGETPSSDPARASTKAAPGTLSCPDVASRLPAVPASARAEVDRDLALLATQITEAERRLRETAGQGGPDFARNAVLGPLASQRTAAIDRIAVAVGRTTTTEPQGLTSLAACTLTR